MSLPLILCLAFGLTGALLSFTQRGAERNPVSKANLILVLGTALVAFSLAFTPIALTPGLDPGRFLALGMGLIVGLGVSYLGANTRIAFAVGLSALPAFIPKIQNIESSPLALWAALAAGIGIAMILTRPKFGSEVAVIAMLGGAINVLATNQLGKDQTQAGLWFLAIVALVSLIPSVAPRFFEEKAVLGKAIVATSLLILLFLVCVQVIALPFSGILVAMSVLAMVAVAWALPNEGDVSVFPALVSGILWVAIGTTAFAEARGLGMGICAISAIGTAVLLGHGRAALTASPLAFLAIYRAFGIENPEASKALDIGQHYGLIGIMLGLLAAFVLAESSDSEDVKVPLFTALATIIGCAFAPLLLGAKGSVGVLAGLGIVPALGLIREKCKVQSFYPAMVTLTGAMLFAFSALKEKLDIERSEKLGTLVYVAIFILIAGVAATYFNRPKTKEPVSL